MASSAKRDSDDYHCHFCAYDAGTAQEVKAHLLGEHAVEIAADEWGRYVTRRDGDGIDLWRRVP
ncbi:hypothetical protein [Halococcus saccharolyticus]|nr:hypothetical protein [Halococcus saccharolyticus]